MSLKQYQNMLDELEPLAAKMKPKDRTGVAFILATTSHRLGDAVGVELWGPQAAVDGVLRARLAEEGVWSAPRRPSTGQTGYT